MKLILLFLGCVAFLFCGGCGESLPATVTGTITIDGADIPSDEGISGNVVFYPTGGGAAAFGSISSNGKYSVTTGTTKGLEPGEYKVTVRVIKIAPEPPGGYAAAPPQELLSPARYNDNEKTDLKVMIEAGKNEHNLDLVSGS